MNRRSQLDAFPGEDFRIMFIDDDACLEWIRVNLYPEKIYCQGCKKPTRHHRIAGRRQYACQECGHHFAPTAGTIFHKSSTPLTTWFYVLQRMAQARGSISAKQVERETGVTYKTAWRMCNEIRKRLTEAQLFTFEGKNSR
jgi:transposase